MRIVHRPNDLIDQAFLSYNAGRLREACQTVLTAVESLDPYTNTLVEELRQEVDKRMTRPASRA